MKDYNFPQRKVCKTLTVFLSEENPVLIQNHVYTDRNSYRKKLAISSKAE